MWNGIKIDYDSMITNINVNTSRNSQKSGFGRGGLER